MVGKERVNKTRSRKIKLPQSEQSNTVVVSAGTLVLLQGCNYAEKSLRHARGE